MSKSGWPSFWHLHPGVRKREELTLGERAADRMRNIMGSWPFVFSFFGVMILWAAVNTYFLQRVIHHLSLIHISEPTRQAEISYAVFCLKKKKKKNKKQT